MKIVKQYRVNRAGASFKVTLPREFVRDVGIAKGDVLNVIYEEGSRTLIVAKRQLTWDLNKYT